VSIVANVEARIQTVSVTDDAITAQLVDGRTISVPLAWSWRLSEATPKQRAGFEIIGSGSGIHWPEVDEDISVEECSTECQREGLPALIVSASDPDCVTGALWERSKRGLSRDMRRNWSYCAPFGSMRHSNPGGVLGASQISASGVYGPSATRRRQAPLVNAERQGRENPLRHPPIDSPLA